MFKDLEHAAMPRILSSDGKLRTPKMGKISMFGNRNLLKCLVSQIVHLKEECTGHICSMKEEDVITTMSFKDYVYWLPTLSTLRQLVMPGNSEEGVMPMEISEFMRKQFLDRITSLTLFQLKSEKMNLSMGLSQVLDLKLKVAFLPFSMV